MDEMTVKRFMVDDAGTLIDMYTGDMFDIVEEVCPLLNEQHETIQRLKQNIDELLSVNVEEELLEENEQLQHDATILIQANQDYRKENEQLKEQWKEKRHEDINELSVIAMKYKALEKENERLRRCINEIYTIARLEEV